MPTFASKTLALPRITTGLSTDWFSAGLVTRIGRQEVGVVAARQRVVDDDPLAAEHVDRLAVEAEEDALHGRELRERVDDLREPRLHRRAAAARLELRGQVDAGDPVLDLEAEELRAVRDRRASP